MSTNLTSLNAEGVHIVPTVEDGVMRISVSGAIEMREPGELLNPFWNSIDEDARGRGIRRVELDLRDLSFMNSSGILTLVRWITKVRGHAPDGAYQLVLLYDRNVTWQRTSIPTLAKLAPAVVVPTEING
jgi:hypothetical protein